MAKRREVKAIIQSRNLTGKEAARLLLKHLVETDHRRPAILTQGEIQQLKSNVSRLSEKDIADYNSWMELYQIAAYTLSQAEVLHLEILLDLSRMESLLQPYLTDWKMTIEAAMVPSCVTEKQWQELQAIQRERKLKKLHCLAEVYEARAEHLAGGYKAFEDLAEEDKASLREEATAEISELMASQDIQPIKLEREESKEREDVAYWPDKDKWPESGGTDHLTLHLTGQQLYQTGLPEWQEWVDTYQTSLYEGDVGNPAGEVAIVLTPAEYNLDERGWYKECWPESFLEVPRLAGAAEKHGLDLRKGLVHRHKAIRKKLRVFLAHQPVFETLSEVTGVKLHEDLEAWLADTQEAVSRYQELLKKDALQSLPMSLRGGLPERAQIREGLRPDLPAFTIDDLKPDPQQIEHLKERMALALTEEDYYQAFRGWMAERCAEIDETEDKLAEEVAANGEED